MTARPPIPFEVRLEAEDDKGLTVVMAHTWRTDPSGSLIFSLQDDAGDWTDVVAYAAGTWRAVGRPEEL